MSFELATRKQYVESFSPGSESGSLGQFSSTSGLQRFCTDVQGLLASGSSLKGLSELLRSGCAKNVTGLVRDLEQVARKDSGVSDDSRDIAVNALRMIGKANLEPTAPLYLLDT